mgnify:CR=1 FL=1
MIFKLQSHRSLEFMVQLTKHENKCSATINDVMVYKILFLGHFTFFRIPVNYGPASRIPVNHGPASRIPVNYGPASGIPVNYGPASRIHF